MKALDVDSDIDQEETPLLPRKHSHRSTGEAVDKLHVLCRQLSGSVKEPLQRHNGPCSPRAAPAALQQVASPECKPPKKQRAGTVTAAATIFDATPSTDPTTTSEQTAAPLAVPVRATTAAAAATVLPAAAAALQTGVQQPAKQPSSVHVPSGSPPNKKRARLKLKSTDAEASSRAPCTLKIASATAKVTATAVSQQEQEQDHRKSSEAGPRAVVKGATGGVQQTIPATHVAEPTTLLQAVEAPPLQQPAAVPSTKEAANGASACQAAQVPSSKQVTETAAGDQPAGQQLEKDGPPLHPLFTGRQSPVVQQPREQTAVKGKGRGRGRGRGPAKGPTQGSMVVPSCPPELQSDVATGADEAIKEHMAAKAEPAPPPVTGQAAAGGERQPSAASSKPVVMFGQHQRPKPDISEAAVTGKRSRGGRGQGPRSEQQERPAGAKAPSRGRPPRSALLLVQSSTTAVVSTAGAQQTGTAADGEAAGPRSNGEMDDAGAGSQSVDGPAKPVASIFLPAAERKRLAEERRQREVAAQQAAAAAAKTGGLQEQAPNTMARLQGSEDAVEHVAKGTTEDRAVHPFFSQKVDAARMWALTGSSAAAAKLQPPSLPPLHITQCAATLSTLEQWPACVSFRTALDAPLPVVLQQANSDAESQQMLYALLHSQHLHDRAVQPFPLNTCGVSNALQRDSHGSQLWTDKYRPQSAAEVCGNSEAVQQLHALLLAHKEAMLAGAEGAAPAKGVGLAASPLPSFGAGKKRLGVPVTDDSDADSDDWIESSQDACTPDAKRKRKRHEPVEPSGPGFAVAIWGPTGCGKTAAVYALAQELDMAVIEVNGSSQRTGAAMTRSVGEATQSRRMLMGSGSQPEGDGASPACPASAKRSKNIGAFFTAKAVRTAGTAAPAVQPAAPQSLPDETLKAASALSILLFEDCDWLHEDERGLATALDRLVRETKCPIVLVSNGPFDAEIATGVSGVRELPFSSPTTEALLRTVHAVCNAEGVLLPDSVLQTAIQHSQNDIRSALLNLQLLTTGERYKADTVDCYAARLDRVGNPLPVPGKAVGSCLHVLTRQLAQLHQSIASTWGPSQDQHTASTNAGAAAVAAAETVRQQQAAFMERIELQQQWQLAQLCQQQQHVWLRPRKRGTLHDYLPEQVAQQQHTRLKRRADTADDVEAAAGVQQELEDAEQVSACRQGTSCQQQGASRHRQRVGGGAVQGLESDEEQQAEASANEQIWCSTDAIGEPQLSQQGRALACDAPPTVISAAAADGQTDGNVAVQQGEDCDGAPDDVMGTTEQSAQLVQQLQGEAGGSNHARSATEDDPVDSSQQAAAVQEQGDMMEGDSAFGYSSHPVVLMSWQELVDSALPPNPVALRVVLSGKVDDCLWQLASRADLASACDVLSTLRDPAPSVWGPLPVKQQDAAAAYRDFVGGTVAPTPLPIQQQLPRWLLVQLEHTVQDSPSCSMLHSSAILHEQQLQGPQRTAAALADVLLETHPPSNPASCKTIPEQAYNPGSQLAPPSAQHGQHSDAKQAKSCTEEGVRTGLDCDRGVVEISLGKSSEQEQHHATVLQLAASVRRLYAVTAASPMSDVALRLQALARMAVQEATRRQVVEVARASAGRRGRLSFHHYLEGKALHLDKKQLSILERIFRSHN